MNVAKPKSFQEIVLRLQNYWSDNGAILQPYDMEVGAGRSTRYYAKITWRKSLGCVYVQPSRRPSDGRYGENPNRLQHYYQFQVIMKPSPEISKNYI